MSKSESEGEIPHRDDTWLAERVSLLRQIHFANVPQGYPIETRFGIRARNRFGSIGAQGRQTIILVNRLFADPIVPVFVVDGTLAHELVHYAHGFNSGLPRLYTDPHRGGIVDKELEIRGLGPLNEKAEQWRKINWDAIYESRCADLSERRASRQQNASDCWNSVLLHPNSRTEAHLQQTLHRVAPQFGLKTPPFTVEWLRATRRQTAPSYWFAKSRTVRLHGLLSSPRVPEAVVLFELGYWLARQCVGDNGPKVQAALHQAGLVETISEAMQWRKRSWTAFQKRHHPLI